MSDILGSKDIELDLDYSEARVGWMFLVVQSS